MGTLWRDARYGVRVLRKNLGFTLAAVLVLALGIGANTAIFGVVYSVLLKPLGYQEPDRLVVALHDGRYPVSPADFLDYRSQTTAFSALGAAQAWGGIIADPERSERVPGLQVTPDLMATLGVRPMLGRLFAADEENPASETRVLLLSHALWQRRFASDPGVIGRAVHVGDQAYTVIGVMPPRFQFAPFWQTQAEMWTPLVLADRNRLHDRTGRSLRVFGRLKPGVSVAQAQAQMDTVAGRLAAAYPDSNTNLTITVVPLHEKVVGSVRTTLMLLLVTVGFVLVIACADIANLLLTRAVGRKREIAVRLAIGASRASLIRQLAIESLLVAACGGAAGLLLARGALNVLRTLLPPATASLPRLDEVGIDATVFGFALLLSLGAGLIAGLLPALQASRVDLTETLKEGGRSSTEGRSSRRTQHALVIVQVSVALVLLVCAGLMIQTLRQLASVDAGFNPHHLLTLDVAAPAIYDTPAARDTLFRRVQEDLASVPGVQAVGAINHLPIAGDIWTLRYGVPGRPAPPPGEEYGAAYRVIRTGYLQAMGITLTRGRDFTDHDTEQAPAVVIINERLARHQWPNADPVGQRLTFSAATGNGTIELTIVGVVRNVRQSDWTGEPNDEIYLPYPQRAGAFATLTFVVRTIGDPDALSRTITERIAAIDRGIPRARPETMEGVIADQLWRSRLSALLLGVFASIALILAAVGIYGVIAYAVRQRTAEIGVRMALGATRMHVLRLVMRDSLTPVAIGIVLGTTVALIATRLVASLLYQVTATDPVTFVLVVATLVATGVMATGIPAWRAMNADPLAALRNE